MRSKLQYIDPNSTGLLSSHFPRTPLQLSDPSQTSEYPETMTNAMSTLTPPSSTLKMLKRRIKNLISRKTNRDLLEGPDSDEEVDSCGNSDHAEPIARFVAIVEANPRIVTTLKPSSDERTARPVRLEKPKLAPKLISISAPTTGPELPKIIITAPTPPETCPQDHDVLGDPQFEYQSASSYRFTIPGGSDVITCDPTDSVVASMRRTRSNPNTEFDLPFIGRTLRRVRSC
jgi:hypothetical protein